MCRALVTAVNVPYQTCEEDLGEFKCFLIMKTDEELVDGFGLLNPVIVRQGAAVKNIYKYIDLDS